jgi:Programmed cell death protein 7
LCEQEAELKKSADATLAEVRRKITDVNQRLKLLSQMRKLRQLRRDKAKQRGVFYVPGQGSENAFAFQ